MHPSLRKARSEIRAEEMNSIHAAFMNAAKLSWVLQPYLPVFPQKNYGLLDLFPYRYTDPSLFLTAFPELACARLSPQNPS